MASKAGAGHAAAQKYMAQGITIAPEAYRAVQRRRTKQLLHQGDRMSPVVVTRRRRGAGSLAKGRGGAFPKAENARGF